MSDDSFNLDDVMEIFGGDVDMPAKESASVATKPAAPSPAPEGDAALTDEELAIIAEYESQKKASAAKEAEAKRKEEEAQRRILEEFEKAQKLKEEQAAAERRAAEEKRKAELAALQAEKEKAVDDNKIQEEELRIIEEFEKAQAEKKEAADKAKKEAEERAQAELRALKQRQEAEKAAREQEEKQLQEKLTSKVDSAKQGRLQELLAKAQKELSDSNQLAPLQTINTAVPTAESVASAGSNGGGDGSFVSLPATITSAENTAMMTMVDEARKSIFTFLAPMIGIRPTNSMLTKTVEKARGAYPVLLKDVNWLPDGDLRDDGSIDGDRLLKNFSSLPAAQAVEMYMKGLAEIFRLRVKSVEMGLGEKVKGDLLNKLSSLRDQLSRDGVDATMIKVFFQHVLKL